MLLWGILCRILTYFATWDSFCNNITAKFFKDLLNWIVSTVLLSRLEMWNGARAHRTFLHFTGAYRISSVYRCKLRARIGRRAKRERGCYSFLLALSQLTRPKPMFFVSWIQVAGTIKTVLATRKGKTINSRFNWKFR